MQKVIFVTGGLGFIGINLILRLLRDDEDVEILLVDNDIYGSRRATFEQTPLAHHSRIHFYGMNICDPSFIYNIFGICKTNGWNTIHEIYHLAAIASPIWYKIYPEETLDVSYIGTKNVFEIGKKYNSKIMICSSSEVYGDAQICPQKEDYFGNTNSYGERACYDEGKRIMEALAYTYQKKYDLKIHIIRIFNTYGPYMNIEDGRVIPSFIKSYLQNAPIQIFNQGTQTRCFNYIDDTLNGMIALMQSNVYTPTNIGNDCEITILQFYEICKRVMNEKFPSYYRELEIVYGVSDCDDPKVRKPDLTKARALLHYEIKTSLEDGLSKTIQYFIDSL